MRTAPVRRHAKSSVSGFRQQNHHIKDAGGSLLRSDKMNSTIWLALALVLVLERAGTDAVSPAHGKNGFGTGATAGKCLHAVLAADLWIAGSCGLLHVEENDWLNKKWSDLPHIECKSAVYLKRNVVESIFKQTLILKNGGTTSSYWAPNR